jgi:hypothetical protein
MTAVLCENAADRKADTWAKRLEPFDRLEFAVSDAARGIAKAVVDIARARRDAPEAPALEHGLDVFHTAMEAHRVLARHWRHAEAAWERAEAADAKVGEAKRQGIDARGVAQAARAAWARATASWERTGLPEAAWGRARAALEVFRADGRLNDRSHAEAEIAGALVGLTGPEWSKVRDFLADPRSLSFLDRMHRRLESAEPRPEWREAMAWRWWLRQGRPTTSEPLTALVRAAGRDRVLDEPERASLRGGVGGPGGHVSGRQRRGEHERRAADAAVTAQADDAADARPEAALLELPSIRRRSPLGGLPLLGPGPGSAHVRLLDAAPGRSGGTGAKTVNR